MQKEKIKKNKGFVILFAVMLSSILLAIALGVWLTAKQSPVWLFSSFLIGGLIGAILLLLKRASLKTKIAFGPFLIIAFWLVKLFYEKGFNFS